MQLTIKSRPKIGDVDQRQPIQAGVTAVTFTVTLKAGPAKLQTWLEEKTGTTRGAYFVDLKRLD